MRNFTQGVSVAFNMQSRTSQLVRYRPISLRSTLQSHNNGFRNFGYMRPFASLDYLSGVSRSSKSLSKSLSRSPIFAGYETSKVPDCTMMNMALLQSRRFTTSSAAARISSNGPNMKGSNNNAVADLKDSNIDSDPDNSNDEFTRTERATQAAQVNFSARLSRNNEIKAKASKGDLMRLFQLAKREKGPLTLAMCMLVFSSLISLSLPAIIGKILDAINSDDPTAKQVFGIPLDYFFFGVGAVFIVGSTTNYFRYLLLRIIGERLVSRLRVQLFKKTISQDAEFFDANRVGDLISRLSTDASIVSKSVTQGIADGLRSGLTCILGVGMMAYTSLVLTSTLVIIMPPVFLGTWYYGRKIKQLSRSFQEALGKLTKVSEERLSSVKVSQQFSAGQQEIRRYSDKIRGVLNIAVQDAKMTAGFHASMQLLGNLSIIGLLGIGGGMVSSGSLSFGELTSFIMYTAYTGGAAAGIGSFYAEVMKGTGAASRLFELIDREPKIHLSRGVKLENPSGLIEFDHVKFSYPTRPAVPIFEDLNFKIQPGSNVCIVGPSGGGKSTITSLLLRFYDPVGGSVKIGGQDLRDLNLNNLRRHIGVVSQEPVLFSGTIADNIRYGVPNASRSQIVEAARKANCTFLSDFPDGLDTKVGARGAQLSGGQKQRIAIARALIKRPSILILDEATSALDSESETLVNEALGRLMQERTSTIISIAHRLSTIRRSDQIVVLAKGGHVAEEGRFIDLYYNPNSALSTLLQSKQDEDYPRATQKHEEEALEELDAQMQQIEEQVEEEELGHTPEEEEKRSLGQF